MPFTLLQSRLILISLGATPLLELRGAIPAGFAMGLDPIEVFLFSVLGNLLPIPFLLILFTPLVKWIETKTRFIKFVDFIYKKTVDNKKSDTIKKYGYLGLALFVAVPLPGTGAWTGSMIAALLQMDFKKSFISIAIGTVIAGILVTSLISLGIKVF
ncbi:Uncharacterized membrane protein [Caldanaerobius fijiensis DSM 17918]|uniref:Uncharacterized membrane protein n=1 Tax=Caldanaerobius fijiensis DSM 17918 TaxID=1121256 RepID=A0A1M5FEB9_9THEO|nr:small multi-drug export protein [Caldanaerobius fijiensis]SHF89492.1 Uncharacterized membrane protein [Caldanaerobius fijiensis DSM 17918]